MSNKAIVLASAVIASIILIAIVIIAVILVGFCFYTNRRKHGDVNLSVAVRKRESMCTLYVKI